jgi:hypothetical protein
MVLFENIMAIDSLFAIVGMLKRAESLGKVL